MRKAIPDRWLNYRPIGERIAGTRFIAFKVPLRKNINESVDDEQLRLAPHSLLESVPNLGLIVDLTNTNRYYNPQTFRDLNVAHQKLMIPGHQTPTKQLAQRFCEYVTDFLDANPDNDKLIGVHCTHGVNRTGYLICYFMITKMNMSPKLAIQTFADARGHKIERKNYTESLQHLTSEQGPCKLLSETSRSPSHTEGKRRLKQRQERGDRREDVSLNWRVRQQEHNGWQQQPPSRQWRNTNTYHSQDDDSQRRPLQRETPRWRQAALSEDSAPKVRRYNDYHSDNDRYQQQNNWRPRQTAGQCPRQEYSFAYNSSSRSSSSYNKSNNSNNYRGNNNYSSRGDNNDNYSRRGRSRWSNNHTSHYNERNYGRDERRSNSNRFRRFETD
ncbi:PREDICTED: probable tyrosine-protein phosphatase F54C8.4 [Drosophila arizonae]|uniref:Probable tyrosine-protein phosphatase F54C8.4 n=1 Tax=Drosophila arizonae TaxID=7263 RepID=A0ABM1PMJ6_DROAR|nr:PREDICTED: probable tyrosine-protein phosphatase F54C8.4 [Drosophila arizonae]